jgi:multiple sugar transport system substrate-binding protein
MDELEFSYMLGFSGRRPISVSEFEDRSRVRVRHNRLNWDTAWHDLLQVALHFKGPDISEIGTTWLGSLIGMQALRPFNTQQIKLLGGSSAFAPSCWQSCTSPEEAQVLAIPWYLDLSLILYRRDLLHKAGINAATAFQTSEHLTDTLLRLKSSGIAYPLNMDTATHTIAIHNAAPWIWEGGLDFRSPDGRYMTVKEPRAIDGIKAFFNLGQFLAPEARGKNAWVANDLFLQGKAAVAISSEQFYFSLKRKEQTASPEVMENLGVAPYLSIPYIGGTNLVIWRHTLNDRAALDLIRFLNSSSSAEYCYREYMVLPARLDTLETLMANDPLHPVISQTLKTGRGIHGFYRWAGVESRLSGVFHQLWVDLFANPEMDLEGEITKRITEVASRLERTTLATW